MVSYRVARKFSQNDDDDFDISALELDSFGETAIDGEMSESKDSPGDAQTWQLSRDKVPKNPNSVATSVAQKLAEFSQGVQELFSFPTDATIESVQKSLIVPQTATATPPQSHTSWGDLGLSRPVLKAISNVLKFPNPTPIQVDTIPAAISGKDILAAAATGSGKTAAFLLPIIERLLMSANVSSRRKDKETGRISGGRPSTRAVILLPTRELAVQCWSMFKALATFVPITSAFIVGGFDSRSQQNDLSKSPDVILATPGRLLDHLLNSQGIHFDNVDMIVLDEADRLLDLGFSDAIMEIMKCIPKKRINFKQGKHTGGAKGPCQTSLFSATLSCNVKDLASTILNDAFTVRVHESAKIVTSLTQEFMKIPKEDCREAAFFSLLETAIHTECPDKRVKGRVIAFFKEKKEAHKMAVLAQAFGLSLTELNGNMNQAERLAAIADFQSGEKRYLFATDIAARGLDLPDVEVVVNFNLPHAADAETRYIHRVGRTARMGRPGLSITLYTAEEYPLVKKIIKKAVEKTDRQRVFERKADPSSLLTWIRRLDACKGLLRDIEAKEKIEQEIFVSAQQLNKAENVIKHERNIARRPKKGWIKK
jgi:ATP-dependent RNA helicase DDX27